MPADIAARGIDIPSVKYVVQYDFPNLEQYVHRCGRAGRRSLRDGRGSGKHPDIGQEENRATVYSFFTRNLQPMAADVVKLLEANDAWVDPNLRALVATQNKNAHGNHGCNEKRPKKKSRVEPAKRRVAQQSNADSFSNYDEKDDDDFRHLAPNRIVLKRASHVSDASSEESSDE